MLNNLSARSQTSRSHALIALRILTHHSHGSPVYISPTPDGPFTRMAYIYIHAPQLTSMNETMALRHEYLLIHSTWASRGYILRNKLFLCFHVHLVHVTYCVCLYTSCQLKNPKHPKSGNILRRATMETKHSVFCVKDYCLTVEGHLACAPI